MNNDLSAPNHIDNGTPVDQPKLPTGASPTRKANIATFKSWSELCTAPPRPLPFLVDELLVSGGTSVWFAKPKVGKSTILQYLAYCVATGTRFLDRTTKTGKVAMLALEDMEEALRANFSSMRLPDDADVCFCTNGFGFDMMASLESVLADRSPTLVIIDTMQQFLSIRDISDYSEVTAALRQIVALARKHDTHIALSHHSAKADRADPTTAGLGSIGITGAVDTVISIVNRDSNRFMSTIQRYGHATENLVLTLDKTNRHVSLGSVTVQPAQTSSDKIFAVLDEYATPLSETELLSRVAGRHQDLVRALREAVSGGLIKRTGNGTKGSPYMYEAIGYSSGPSGDPEALPFSEMESFLVPTGDRTVEESGTSFSPEAMIDSPSSLCKSEPTQDEIS